VATWQEIIRTFPWERAPRGPRTAHAAAVELLAELTIAICDYEDATRLQRLRRRLDVGPGDVPLTQALARYGNRLAASRPG
jgi:hypothetical protein